MGNRLQETQPLFSQTPYTMIATLQCLFSPSFNRDRSKAATEQEQEAQRETKKGNICTKSNSLMHPLPACYVYSWQRRFVIIIFSGGVISVRVSCMQVYSRGSTRTLPTISSVASQLCYSTRPRLGPLTDLPRTLNLVKKGLKIKALASPK